MDYQHLTHYYKGKKVFLTGHTGFKGSWLLYWLHMLGAEVKGYSLPPLNEFDLYHKIHGNSLCHSIISDIRNGEQLSQEILSFEPDFIFHLAAQPLVKLSYEIPSETFAVNTLGTANLLDAVRHLKKQCSVILVTTDKVYENKEWYYPYRETDVLGGYDPYSASKACAELVINSFRNSFFNTSEYSKHGKGIASARAGNVIGGGDWSKDRIIPDIIRALSKNEPVSVRNPLSVRPWQHVLEPLGGYLHLGAKLSDNPTRFSESWNFGPNPEDNLTVEELVHLAIELWGSGSYKKTQLVDQPHEAGLLKLDINKTTNLLGWTPKYNASEAVNKTVEWYKNDLEGNDNFIGEQVKAFQEQND
ncbi:CDP-glucose 4,6-dehydratase [Dyadobacter sp. CY323]|uniref:CDP-glucose 4,6-dehydratase n=1 Tax=Dyadobacter sp. CY323 TaxID=2907302 RepID=UPI001F1E95ED|nr:CDP-glucose 4,6-dehydratase [Dyadobacter sp. CY323]MCE6990951.1 CDP-glucose 4,6-dehydratase [Dyadobacter sp. CY323]